MRQSGSEVVNTKDMRREFLPFAPVPHRHQRDLRATRERRPPGSHRHSARNASRKSQETQPPIGGIVARHTTAVKGHVGQSDRRLIGAVVRCGVGADG